MKKLLFLILSITIFNASCKKDNSTIENPQPVEQELITTIQLVVTGSGGFNKTFTYKVENGFGTTTQGNVSVDSVVLMPDTNYSVAVKVLNEKANPAEDVTDEVISEKDEHLFLFQSAPATGAGSVAISNGSKDNKGLPFNQVVTLQTGGAGKGMLVVTLKHQPTDKTAQEPGAAGGETDAEANFPVVLR